MVDIQKVEPYYNRPDEVAAKGGNTINQRNTK